MTELRTVLLLVVSNCFMTAAWYGSLRFKPAPLWLTITASWLVALPEYMFQVPANRHGYAELTAYQLKILQEVITLSIFVLFAWLFLGEAMTMRYLVSFVLILGAVVVAFY